MVHLSLTTLAAVLALATSALQAQKPTVPAVDPSLPAKLKQLKSFLKDRKMLLDFQAINLIQVVSRDVPQQNPKDKSKIVKGLTDVFKTGKVRDGSKDILYRETSDALTKYEVDGAKALRKYVDHKRFEDNLRLRGHLLRSIGKTKDVKQIKYLIEVTTRSRHDELRAASGEALGNFRHAKATTQRNIVKEIVRAWGSLHSKATSSESVDPNGSSDFGPQNARRTLRACEGKWVSTLQKLTGVSQSKFPQWQRWLNKNKSWKIPS